jgi:DNA-directed RNA polymerase subunit RPC12/RpoP
MVSALMGDMGTPVHIAIGEEGVAYYSSPNSICGAASHGNDETTGMLRVSSDGVIDHVDLDMNMNITRPKIIGVLCEECGKLSRDKFNSSQHRKLHITNGELSVCLRCSQVFSDPYYLSVHSSLCKYSCPQCSFKDTRKERVLSHQRRVHKYDNLA